MSQQLSLDFGNPGRLEPGISRTVGVALQVREIKHEGVLVRYQLNRSRRRSIGLSITESGLRITAPHWVGINQIEEVIRKKFPWIQRKIQEVQARHERLLLSDAAWHLGGRIPYLGIPLVLEAATPEMTGITQPVWFEGDPSQPKPGQRLWLTLPPEAQPEQIREMAQVWLQARARQWFDERLKMFAASCGLAPTSWRLSSARGRWGSCNSHGKITLNWKLIHFEPAAIDYVIAHELAHLRELNHSDAFWRVLKGIYPNYLEGHRILKSHTPGELPNI